MKSFARKTDAAPLAPSGLSLLHEHFAVAYAALEIAKPGAVGNGSTAYAKASPGSSRKTAQNQATTLLRRVDVRARIEQLLLDAKGAEHVIRAGAFIDDLLLDAAVFAREQKDAATLGRIAELMDRGRLGGPRLVKETRSRALPPNPFAGKTAAQIRAIKEEAVAFLRGESREDEGAEPQVGAGDRGSQPVH